MCRGGRRRGRVARCDWKVSCCARVSATDCNRVVVSASLVHQMRCDRLLCKAFGQMQRIRPSPNLSEARAGSLSARGGRGSGWRSGASAASQSATGGGRRNQPTEQRQRRAPRTHHTPNVKWTTMEQPGPPDDAPKATAAAEDGGLGGLNWAWPGAATETRAAAPHLEGEEGVLAVERDVERHASRRGTAAAAPRVAPRRRDVPRVKCGWFPHPLPEQQGPPVRVRRPRLQGLRGRDPPGRRRSRSRPRF